jgi:hypothetical protein
MKLKDCYTEGKKKNKKWYEAPPFVFTITKNEILLALTVKNLFLSDTLFSFHKTSPKVIPHNDQLFLEKLTKIAKEVIRG